jgi:hypothetical protein
MLAHYYGVTTARATEMVHEGLVPAADAMKALIQYQHQAGYEGKNFAMATKTLSGAWATFQDIMRFAAGRGESGLFGRVKKALTDIDAAMLPLIQGNKPITIYMVAQALDTALSPKTHTIIYLFSTFEGILKGILSTFYVFFWVINRAMRLLNRLTGSSHNANRVLFVFGFILGINIALMIVWRFTMYTVAIAVLFATGAQWLYNFALGATYAFALAAGIATLGMAGAIFAVGAAIFLLLGLLVVLYFRWNRFHRAVDRFGNWLYAHEYLLTFIPIFGPMIMLIVMVIKYWDKLTHGIRRAYNILIKFKNAVTGVAGFLGRGARFASRNVGLQGLAGGGMVTNAGYFRTGESGPEVVHLPRGAAVSPAGAGIMGGSFLLTIQPAPVIIDGREVAKVVFKHRLDRIARR